METISLQSSQTLDSAWAWKSKSRTPKKPRKQKYRSTSRSGVNWRQRICVMSIRWAATFRKWSSNTARRQYLTANENTWISTTWVAESSSRCSIFTAVSRSLRSLENLRNQRPAIWINLPNLLTRSCNSQNHQRIRKKENKTNQKRKKRVICKIFQILKLKELVLISAHSWTKVFRSYALRMLSSSRKFLSILERRSTQKQAESTLTALLNLFISRVPMTSIQKWKDFSS